MSTKTNSTKRGFRRKKFRQKKSSANLLFGEKIFDENAFDQFFFDEMSGNRLYFCGSLKALSSCGVDSNMPVFCADTYSSSR